MWYFGRHRRHTYYDVAYLNAAFGGILLYGMIIFKKNIWNECFSSLSLVSVMHRLDRKIFCGCNAGSGLGMKNWLRVTFAVDLPLLEDGLERLKSFCLRHAKPNRKQVTS